MILDISVNGCGLHQLGSIYFAEKLYVNRLPILIDSMMSLRIMLQDFIDFVELEILEKEIKNRRLNI